MTYPYTLTLQSIEPVTHDTAPLPLRPARGVPVRTRAGHASGDRPGRAWRDEDRPFTMVSQPEERDHLDFVIKIYDDHDGVTQALDTLKPGDRVLATEPEGAITDHGAGTFLAAGAGITPFIAILDARARNGGLKGEILIFANKTKRDIILPRSLGRSGRADDAFRHRRNRGRPARRADRPRLSRGAPAHRPAGLYLRTAGFRGRHAAGRQGPRRTGRTHRHRSGLVAPSSFRKYDGEREGLAPRLSRKETARQRGRRIAYSAASRAAGLLGCVVQLA